MGPPAGIADPRVAPHRRPPGAGRLLPALHSPGARRGPRGPRVRSPHPHHRSQLDYGQSAGATGRGRRGVGGNAAGAGRGGVRRRAGGAHARPPVRASSAVATSTPRSSPSASTSWPSRPPTWPRSPNGRIDRLLNPDLSGLPAFLTPKPGIRSGLMVAQVTAADALSEMRVLASPASVDSVSTSAAQEDHVSMGMAAARKVRRSVELLELVLAVELLCAAQAVEFHRPAARRAGRGRGVGDGARPGLPHGRRPGA